MLYRRVVLIFLGLMWIEIFAYGGRILIAGRLPGQDYWVGCIILLLVTVGILESLGPSGQGQ